MKKVKKVLTSKVVADVAPSWFVSAMEKVATKHDVQNVVPAWFAPAMEKVIEKKLRNFATKDDLSGFATKDDLSGFATKDDLKREISHLARKDEMASSFCTIIDMLEECAKKDDFRKLESRLNKTMTTLSNHETRIIHLEGNFPPVSLRSSH